jgi:hypothetical protein
VERLLARLERRFGRYAPGNLTYGLIGAQLLGLLLMLQAPEKAGMLAFDIDAILRGEAWRLFTWLAIPTTTSPLWMLFSLYWLYMIGTALESEWGAFKFLVYWIFGVLGTVVAASLAHAPATNKLFLMTLFLAFATRWPEYEIRIFLIAPVKVKWLALLDGAYLIWYTLSQPGLAMLLPILAVGNYLLFFHESLLQLVRRAARQAERAGARQHFKGNRDAAGLPLVRRCAICAASNDDPQVEIRVCDCEKCGGVRRDLCLPHVRNH